MKNDAASRKQESTHSLKQSKSDTNYGLPPTILQINCWEIVISI